MRGKCIYLLILLLLMLGISIIYYLLDRYKLTDEIKEIQYEVSKINHQKEIQKNDINKAFYVRKEIYNSNLIEFLKVVTDTLNKKLIFLYIPESFCNECYQSQLKLLYSSIHLNNYNVVILCHKAQYRHNLIFQERYDFYVRQINSNFKIKIDKPFLFTLKRDIIESIYLINKNQDDFTRAYISGVLGS